MTLFAENYFDARGKFLQATALAGLEVETFWHPDVVALDGRGLAIDVARAGREDASHVLFTVCGTHGVEGYPGSAAQIQLLGSGRLARLPEHVAVVFLHALNPYGWDRNSQRNEDGIDMNRNFVDFPAKETDDIEAVELLAEVLDIEEMSFGAIGGALTRLQVLQKELGVERLVRQVSGQYSHPRGFKFGGAAPCWSNRMYRKIVRSYLSKAEYIAEVEWHTGLGRFGETIPLCFAPPRSEEFRVTSEWWGEAAVDAGQSAWSPEEPEISTPEYSGLTHAALMEEAPQARLAGGNIEFGTMPLDQISSVTILDHWLTFKAPPTADLDFWRAQMRTIMAPRSPAWEASVLAKAEHLYSGTLDGLERWRTQRPQGLAERETAFDKDARES